MEAFGRKLRFLISVLLLSALCACHSENSPIPDQTNPVVDPLEVSLADVDSMILLGVTTNSLNPEAVELRFVLTGAIFGAASGETSVMINGQAVPDDNITISGSEAVMKVKLDEGKNEVTFKSYDSIGRPLFLEKTVWSGQNNLQINIVDESGAALLQPVFVRLSLSDDPTIEVHATTSNGRVEFQSIPSRTVVVEARTDSNLLGVSGGVGWDGTMTVRMVGLNPPSVVDNNDLSSGLDGWNFGNSPVVIVPHVEQVGPQANAGMPSIPRIAAPDLFRRHYEHAAVEMLGSSIASIAVQNGNNDVQLSTRGEGPQALSRTFVTKPGTTSVTVRYHFVTREVPGGYFGSWYNDYFTVGLRSKLGGAAAAESNTMNGLGLEAFDARGATQWRSVILKTSAAGDEVQLDAIVANVADRSLDSRLVIDGLIENGAAVEPALSWDPVAGGLKLTYTVTGEKALEEDVKIDVFWANGTAYSARIGAPLFSHVVPAGTARGKGQPIAIPGANLIEDPKGTTHLLAASSEAAVGAVADVRVEYGANANAAAVSEAMVDVVKDGLRAAGIVRVTITSTARTPFDQARAMFNNLVNPANSVAINTSNQLLLYAPGGDAVINVFINATAGRTLAQINAVATEVRALMQAEIVARGPSSVSAHCADPAMVSVIDIRASTFSASNSQLFRVSVRPRLRPDVTGFIDERATNNAYHLEL